jgi:hypothetical protein
LRAVTHSVSQKPCRMNGGVRHGSLGEPRTTEVLCCVRVSTSVWRRRKKARGRWVALSGAAVIASRWIRRPGLWKTKHVPRRGSWSTRAVGEVCLHAVCFSKPVRQSQRHQRVRHVDEMASYHPSWNTDQGDYHIREYLGGKPTCAMKVNDAKP